MKVNTIAFLVHVVSGILNITTSLIGPNYAAKSRGTIQISFIPESLASRLLLVISYPPGFDFSDAYALNTTATVVGSKTSGTRIAVENMMIVP